MSSVFVWKWLSAISPIMRIFSRSSLVRIGWRTSRRLRSDRPFTSNRFGRGPMNETRLITASSRIGSIGRVGDLREVLLEVVVEQLRLAREHGHRRVGAHGADRLLAGGGHRRHQELQVLLRVAEGLLAIEQRGVGHGRARGHGRQVLQHDLRAGEPLPVGIGGGEAALQLVVRDDAAFFKVDEQHLAGLQPPLGDDLLLRDRQHADLRRHDDEAVVGHDIARRPAARCGRAWRRSGARR